MWKTLPIVVRQSICSRPCQINATKPLLFHKTLQVSSILRINPLLPFDVLEDLQSDELEEKNEKLKKEKRILKKKLKKNEQQKEYKTENDSVPLNKAVSPEVEELELQKTSITTSSSTTSSSSANYSDNSRQAASGSEASAVSGGNNGGNGNNGNNKPPRDEGPEEEEEKEFDKEEEEHEESKFKEALHRFNVFLFKCLETIGITFSSVGILGVAGYLYHTFYNRHVLDKIDMAFEAGDPGFQLSIHKRTSKHIEDDDCVEHDISKYWVERPQQQLLDDIISGKIIGRYFLVVGEKGTGKTSLLLESMKKVDGHNVAVFDAHADPEIFRIRLGRALNFTFNEDYIGSLFSIRGPRDTTALLDIERAFNKLEELAIRRVNKTGNRPLIMIINNAHLIKENEEGIKLIELLQQKAESLSGSGLMTMIFNSDDYWVYEKLKKLGTRLELVNVRDFNRFETLKSLKFIREKHFPSHKFPDLSLDDDTCHKIYDLIGGRPQHILQVARHKNIFNACHEIIDREKTWFLNQCGILGFQMDDDVMEHGKFSSSAMLLMREFVEMDRERKNTLILQNAPESKDQLKNHDLPELPLWRARQIMTRPDYIQQYDNLNIFTIDSESRVRADSIPMMRAFHEIASQPSFDDLLEDTLERVADIESLGRTREVLIKDLNLGSKYSIKNDDNEYQISLQKSDKHKFKIGDVEEDNGGTDYLYLEDVHRKESRKWWKKRMNRFNNRKTSDGTEFDIDINRN